MGFKKKLYHFIGSLKAKATRRYFYEDYVRVYPDGQRFDTFGKPRHTNDEAGRKNLLNHQKFYRFASQFVEGCSVVDLGCGTGYGATILHEAKAVNISGCDLSQHALKYAEKHFGDIASFSCQGVTELNQYESNSFDVAISCEVLEHVKDFGVEDQAVQEMLRVLKPDGLAIIGTPNLELLDGHGFSFEDISKLLNQNFREHLLFENAFIPFGKNRASWEKRVQTQKVGTIVPTEINWNEVLIPREGQPDLKTPNVTGAITFNNRSIDLTHLHNTHSWVAIAMK